MKILTILGARPQFIKAGSISREVHKHAELSEVIVHTGQHYDTNMSDIFFEEMEIPKPDYFLGIGGKSHGAMTGQMMEKIEQVAIKEKPDWMMVYGDTNSTLAGALVASKLHIKLAHVEAGLRSFNTRMPEEINRILTDRVSQLLFCPTDASMKNLYSEGFEQFGCRFVKSGDVMQDGAIFYKKLAKKPTLDSDENFVLCTVHRAENTNNLDNLNQIIDALNEVNTSVKVVVPLHPRTKKIIEDNGITTEFKVIDPVGYLEMVWLISNCQFIMTDSGGLQKEAFFFEKPCITLREETEWLELIENRFNVLVGSEKNRIIHAVESIGDLNNKYGLNLYGNGKASQTIIMEFLR